MTRRTRPRREGSSRGRGSTVSTGRPVQAEPNPGAPHRSSAPPHGAVVGGSTRGHRAPRPGRRGTGRIDLTPGEFRRLGEVAVTGLAEFLGGLRRRPIVPTGPGERAGVRLPRRTVPRYGRPADAVVREAMRQVIEGSVLNIHPRYLGYVTQSAAPLGAIADLIAATINPNLRAREVAPIACDIERQTVRWVGELLGLERGWDGLLTGGGTEANLIGVVCALHRLGPSGRFRRDRLGIYATDQTHVWLRKCARLLGLPERTLRWVPAGADQAMDIGALRRALHADRRRGIRPFLVVGNAGTTATGAIDPLAEIARECRRQRLWMHVDAAYGGFAVLARGHPAALDGLRLADSLTVDPHKWMYVPLDAGCALVRQPAVLRAAFSVRPNYYSRETGEGPIVPDYFELGLQNSRAFRALKVWMQLQHVGMNGYRRSIERDLALAARLHARVRAEADLQALTLGLSTVTFRFFPRPGGSGTAPTESALNRWNAELLDRIQRSGVAYLSHAWLGSRFVLRACVVNFRTTARDIDFLPGWVRRTGREVLRDLGGRRRAKSAPGPPRPGSAAGR